MIRQIVLDLETTGLYSTKGDRVIEIGMVELIDRQITGKEKSFYINPERPCSTGAFAIHGLTDEFLSQQPKFFEIIDDLINFINGSQLIIHNASFDIGFLEVEFGLLNKGPFSNYYSDVFDTLQYAREKFPGKRSSLDALCTMFEISSTHRVKHGALLDAKLLAEVYLCLTRGQELLDISELIPDQIDFNQPKSFTQVVNKCNYNVLISFANEEELLAHHSILNSISSEISDKCIWMK